MHYYLSRGKQFNHASNQEKLLRLFERKFKSLDEIEKTAREQGFDSRNFYVPTDTPVSREFFEERKCLEEWHVYQFIIENMDGMRLEIATIRYRK